jgi:transcription factor 1
MRLLLRVPLRIATPPCRLYSTRTTLPPLPPLREWKKKFPILNKDARHRVLFHNENTAKRLANAFLNSTDYDRHGSQGRVIIEAFPGPGTLSRAILQHPPSVVRKLILLEDNEQYLGFLRACVPSWFGSR